MHFQSIGLCRPGPLLGFRGKPRGSRAADGISIRESSSHSRSHNWPDCFERYFSEHFINGFDEVVVRIHHGCHGSTGVGIKRTVPLVARHHAALTGPRPYSHRSDFHGGVFREWVPPLRARRPWRLRRGGCARAVAKMERPPGIEPGSAAWKADARPIGQGRGNSHPIRTYSQAIGRWGCAVRVLSSSAALAVETTAPSNLSGAAPAGSGMKQKSPQGVNLAGFVYGSDAKNPAQTGFVLCKC